MTNEENRVALIKKEILTDISNHRNDFTYDIEDFYHFEIESRIIVYCCKDPSVNLIKITQLADAFDMKYNQVDIYKGLEDWIVSFTDVYYHFSWEDDPND